MNEQTSQSSDSFSFLNAIDSQTKNIVFNLPKPSYDEDTQVQTQSNNIEKYVSFFIIYKNTNIK